MGNNHYKVATDLFTRGTLKMRDLIVVFSELEDGLAVDVYRAEDPVDVTRDGPIKSLRVPFEKSELTFLSQNGEVDEDKEAEYIKNGFNSCYYCKSDNIDGSKPIELDESGTWHRMKCNDCGGYWIDHYEISYVEEYRRPVLAPPAQNIIEPRIDAGVIVTMLTEAYKEGGEVKALEVSKDCVLGLTVGQIVKIARGEATLTGSSPGPIHYVQ